MSTTPPRRIRVLVVEPHPAVRRGLVALLNRHSDIEVIGESFDCADAARLTRDLLPDVITIDAALAARETAKTLGAIRASNANAHILLMCTLARETTVEALLGSDIAAYCWKDADEGEIAAAIRRSAD